MACVRWLAVVLLVATSALARGENDTAGRMSAARALYDRGQAHYDLGEFDEAIAQFKEAYELSRAPRLMFNIAQAYRLKKDWEQALFFYNNYLRLVPNAPNRADVESRIAEMQEKIRSRPEPTPAVPEPAPAKEPPPPVVAPPPAAVTTPPPQGEVARKPPRSRFALRVGGLAAAGAGVVLIAVGAYFAAVAQSDANALAGLARSGGTWSPAESAVYSEGQRGQAVGAALLSVGGAAAVGGAALLGIGWGRR
jgi:tetratricopeptide (TPR) repeat protein